MNGFIHYMYMVTLLYEVIMKTEKIKKISLQSKLSIGVEIYELGGIHGFVIYKYYDTLGI